MKVSELLSEAKMSPELRDVMSQKGYTFLDSGQDQDVYLAPDGTIMKIFGWDKNTPNGGLSRAHQSFVDFANYCKENANNPFLPDFSSWKSFDYDGNSYLEIRSERLFNFNNKAIANELEWLVFYIDNNGYEKGFAEFIQGDERTNDDARNELILLIGGERKLRLLAKTIADLATIANSKGYTFDLHKGNFMLGSDGTVVINDPFFTGSSRQSSTAPVFDFPTRPAKQSASAPTQDSNKPPSSPKSQTSLSKQLDYLFNL